MNLTGTETDSDRTASFLATEPAKPADWWIAAFMMAVSLLGFVAGLPFISVRLAAVSAFIPSYEAGLLVIDFATAILLFSLFAYLRSWALLIIAAGYVFDGLMVIPHALTFPGAFTASGLLGAGPQTTAWLYEFWHLGFPLSGTYLRIACAPPARSLLWLGVDRHGGRLCGFCGADRRTDSADNRWP